MGEQCMSFRIGTYEIIWVHSNPWTGIDSQKRLHIYTMLLNMIMKAKSFNFIKIQPCFPCFSVFAFCHTFALR